MKLLKKLKRLSVTLLAFILVFCFSSTPVFATEYTPATTEYQTIPLSLERTLIAASGQTSFVYQGEITMTLPAGKTAEYIRVVGARNGVANTGATAEIKSSQVLSVPFTFALDGQYHDFDCIDVTNKTVTYTITIVSGDITQQYNVAIVMCYWFLTYDL